MLCIYPLKFVTCRENFIHNADFFKMRYSLLFFYLNLYFYLYKNKKCCKIDVIIICREDINVSKKKKGGNNSKPKQELEKKLTLEKENDNGENKEETAPVTDESAEVSEESKAIETKTEDTPDEKDNSDEKDVSDEKNDSDGKDDTAETDDSDENDDEVSEQEKPILPRKRRITKNIQLYVTSCITGAALLFIIIWGLFFNQSVFGTWNYEVPAEETADTASTADEPTNSVITYEFKKDGTCVATYGTMSMDGTFQLASTEDYGNVISISTLYGTYSYKVKGNAFTGRRLELTNIYYDEDNMILKKGKASDPLTPYENPQLDERLIGKWYDSDNDIIYEFTEDGEMYRTTGDGFTVRHYYTILQANQILAKYYGQTEDSRTYGYEFDGDTLYIETFLVTKMDS